MSELGIIQKKQSRKREDFFNAKKQMHQQLGSPWETVKSGIS